MKRLRDEVSSDPLVAQAQALLAQVEPVAADPARRQRVRARLCHHPRRKRGRVLTIALVLASGAAMASTLAVRVYHARHVEPPSPQPVAAHTSAPAAPPAAVEPPTAVEVPAAIEPETEPAPRPVHRKHAAAAPSEEESALLIAAVQALRRDHDPTRAGALIDDYLRRFEHGALAEEALALAIEAAATRGDERAADFGADYLRRFPNGRYRAAAENARARFGK
jgi:hypothetical protein